MLVSSPRFPIFSVVTRLVVTIVIYALKTAQTVQVNTLIDFFGVKIFHKTVHLV